MPVIFEKKTDRERVRSTMLKLMGRESTHDSARIAAGRLLLDMGEDQDATKERVDSLWSALDAPKGYEPVKVKWIPRQDVELHAIVCEHPTGVQMADLKAHFVDFTRYQISQALQRLKDKNLIVADGHGKGMLYLPAPMPDEPVENALPMP